MAPSFRGDSNFDQLIISRIRASVRNLADAKKQLVRQGIKGDTYDTLKTLLCEIVNIVEADIGHILEEIAEIGREDIKIHRSDRLHRVLEEFLYLLDTIQATTSQIPAELSYLSKTTLRELGHENIKTVLICGASLGTTNLSDGLKNLFGFFNRVLTYISTQTFHEKINLAPRIELFARRKVEGWDCWGNEVESDIELGVANP